MRIKAFKARKFVKCFWSNITSKVTSKRKLFKFIKCLKVLVKKEAHIRPKRNYRGAVFYIP